MNKRLFKPKVIYFGLYDSIDIRVTKLELKFFSNIFLFSLYFVFDLFSTLN